MKMMKNWIALLLALCMMAALGVASACCTEPTGMEEPQTMEETCACMMDGKGVDGCECMDGMCGDKCACGEGCKCAEKRLDMLAAEMNALFEKNMELWNKLFGMMSKQPDMSMTYADYLMEQLEAAREKFTQDEYKLLQQDIELTPALFDVFRGHVGPLHLLGHVINFQRENRKPRRGRVCRCGHFQRGRVLCR